MSNPPESAPHVKVTTTEPERPKPGVQTSEFWLTVVALAVLVAAEPLGLHMTEDLRAILVASVIGVYAAGRSLVKR